MKQGLQQHLGDSTIMGGFVDTASEIEKTQMDQGKNVLLLKIDGWTSQDGGLLERVGIVEGRELGGLEGRFLIGDMQNLDF